MLQNVSGGTAGKLLKELLEESLQGRILTENFGGFPQRNAKEAFGLYFK